MLCHFNDVSSALWLDDVMDGEIIYHCLEVYLRVEKLERKTVINLCIPTNVEN